MGAVFALALLGGAGVPAFAAPPVEESLGFAVVTLNHLELESPAPLSARNLPKSPFDLPTSVRPYLRPTKHIDSASAPVEKAARAVLKVLVPGPHRPDLSRDSRAVAGAVQAWLTKHLLPISPTALTGIDLREARPKVSELLKAGAADPDGRACAAVALLRALRVPARLAYARGGLEPQIWIEAQRSGAGTPKSAPEKRSKHALKPAAPKVPEGWWECLDAGYGDPDVDAWSLDSSEPELLRWKPAQELSIARERWERVVFDESDTQDARAAFREALASGRIPVQKRAKSLAVGTADVLENPAGPHGGLWELTVVGYRATVEGALAPLESMQVLTPYRPDYGTWGREQRGVLRANALDAQGVWCDRPDRLRVHLDLKDEWASPPPALGMLHWYDFGVKGDQQAFEARRAPGRIDGVVLRADNLSPRSGWRITVSSTWSTATAQASTGKEGRFSVALDPALDAAELLNVVASSPTEEGQSRLLLGR
jgi:hypothetical protein